MTSILGTLSTLMPPSGGDRMQVALRSAVSSGTIGAADQAALSGALTRIGGVLQASSPTIGTDPATMAAKVGALVDREAADGRLTTDQAAELKQLFAGEGDTAGTPTPAAEGVGGAVQSVVDFLRDLRLTIKGHYSPTGATAAAAPVGALVSALA